MTLATIQQQVRDWLVAGSVDIMTSVRGSGHAGCAVYRNNYRTALGDCLSENFATTCKWLGDDAFGRAVGIHIDATPPHSWTLDAYVIGFPATLDALYPDDPEVGDLARLERDLGLVYVGADAKVLQLADLASIDWEDTGLAFAPTVTLLSMKSNAPSLWAAIQADHTPPAAFITEEPFSVVLWRKDFTAKFRTLGPQESRAIAMIQDGKSFAELCAVFADEIGAEQSVQTAGRFLGQWVNEGMIAAIDPEN